MSRPPIDLNILNPAGARNAELLRAVADGLEAAKDFREMRTAGERAAHDVLRAAEDARNAAMTETCKKEGYLTKLEVEKIIPLGKNPFRFIKDKRACDVHLHGAISAASAPSMKPKK